MSVLHVGIDFGTTRTVVALQDRDSFPVVSFTSGASGSEPTEFHPSLVSERRGELRFGFEAAACIGKPDWSVLRSFKRLLSARAVGPDTSIRIGAAEITLLDLLTRYASQLRQDLVEHSNLAERQRGSATFSTFVAVPAHAPSAQRFVTMEAFRRAGFDVVGLMNEPSAAGVEYAHRYSRTITKTKEIVLVYDLGGGTFDVSLVAMSGRSHEVLASSGLSLLGGDDFDEVLLELVLEQSGVEANSLSDDQKTLARICCQAAKEQIGSQTKAFPVDLVSTGVPEFDAPVEVSAAQYFERVAPLVDQTIEVADRLIGGEILERELAGVYVVGGASALPCVARALRTRFGRRVRRSLLPSASTAVGLAINHHQARRIQVKERFSRHFGVFREALDGAAVSFDSIIAKGTPLPGRDELPLVVRRSYRPRHDVGHYRFAECSTVERDGTPTGEIVPFAEVRFPYDVQLRGLDLRDHSVSRMSSDGPHIEERYTVDASGVVELEIEDLDDGYHQRHHVRAGVDVRR